jgi:hypothetical protein
MDKLAGVTWRFVKFATVFLDLFPGFGTLPDV